MRIAIVYDCLYPHTIGGAERWYRALAERLSQRHEITYVTRRQWGPEGPGTPFRAVAVAPGGSLYTATGRRRIWPPVRFGIGVFFHMLRHAKRYDVVHCCSFPYFSLIGAWLALRIRRRGRLIVDWHEVWGRDYWIEYLGPVGGRIGHAVQRLCVAMPERSFTFSRMHAERLAAEGHRGPITRLTGEYSDDANGAGPDGDAVSERRPLVVFAGRHIPEKRVPLVPEAIASARRTVPQLRCTIFGDGPDHDEVRDRARALGLEEIVELPGRAPGDVVRRTIGDAACLLLPSLREGHGLVVVEALARGTPAVVVAGAENAAVELIEPGVNGYVSPSPDPDAIAAAVATAIEGGEELRRTTIEWYRAHEHELSIESSLAAVEQGYESEEG